MMATQTTNKSGESQDANIVWGSIELKKQLERVTEGGVRVNKKPVSPEKTSNVRYTEDK